MPLLHARRQNTRRAMNTMSNTPCQVDRQPVRAIICPLRDGAIGCYWMLPLRTLLVRAQFRIQAAGMSTPHAAPIQPPSRCCQQHAGRQVQTSPASCASSPSSSTTPPMACAPKSRRLLGHQGRDVDAVTATPLWSGQVPSNAHKGRRAGSQPGTRLGPLPSGAGPPPVDSMPRLVDTSFSVQHDGIRCCGSWLLVFLWSQSVAVDHFRPARCFRRGKRELADALLCTICESVSTQAHCLVLPSLVRCARAQYLRDQ